MGHTGQWLGAVVVALAMGRAGPVEGAGWTEAFGADPREDGWVTHGDGSLFRWDGEAGAVEVTWDSARPNSYLAKPLGLTVSKADDFGLEFDLRLESIEVGTTEGKPYTFQIAVGWLNWAEATRPGFLRGTGMDSPNLVEFDYFPDSGFGATVAPTMISTNGQFASGFTFPLELAPGRLYRVKMVYRAATRSLSTTMTEDGEAFGPVQDAVLGEDFTDVGVDHVAIMSYSDAGQDPMFAGSVRARGWVDNVVVTGPDAPSMAFGGTWSEGHYTVTFAGTPGWRYTLERTTDWTGWDAVGESVEGAGDRQILVDAAPPGARAFYRLRAER